MSEHLEFRDEHSEAPAVAWHQWLAAAMPRMLWVPYFAVLCAWIGEAEGGLGATFVSVFGWHALLMSLLVCVFLQEAVLFMSSPLPKGGVALQIASVLRTKWTHLILLLLGALCWIGGHIAIVRYKELAPQPAGFPFYSMFTPHSWLAASVLVLAAVQPIVAVAAFFVCTSLRNTAVAEMHRFLGKAIYFAGLAVCALGFQDMQSSDLCGSVAPYVDTSNFTSAQIDGMGYYPYSTEARLSCAAVVLLFCQGLAVFLALEARRA